MESVQTSPRVALARWLAQLHYNGIRNVETVVSGVTRTDGNLARGTALRGFKIADDLVLTRKRIFYKIKGRHASPISVEAVSANYSLLSLQLAYREATNAWKNTQRHRK